MKIFIIKYYFTSVAWALIATAFGKIISVMDPAMVFNAEEPIFKLSYHNLFVAASCVEVAIALACFFVESLAKKATLVLWLSMVFVVYRLGLLAVRYSGPCPCLGSLTGLLHITPATANRIVLVLLAYMLSGSLFVLIGEKYLWKANSGVTAEIIHQS